MFICVFDIKLCNVILTNFSYVSSFAIFRLFLTILPENITLHAHSGGKNLY